MPSRSQHLTTGELAAELGLPIWLVRRAVDALRSEVPRVGQYRAIPPRLAERVRRALARRPESAQAGGGAPA